MNMRSALCILVILVTGGVLLSGCISSASMSTGSVATPLLQLVHKTVPVTPSPTPTPLAPVTTTPVTTPTAQMMCTTVPVTPSATPTPLAPVTTAPVTTLTTQMLYTTLPVTPSPTLTGYWTTTTYQDDESAYEYLKPAVSAGGAAGTLVVRVEGCPADGLTVYIARNVTNGLPVDNRYLLDQMVPGDENPVFLPVKILPDGSSESVRMAPGFYTVYLPDKTGNEIEDTETFTIGANFMTYLSLSGSSYSTPAPSCGCNRPR